MFCCSIISKETVFAPSTGYVEVGGLSSQQVLYIISRLSLVKGLKAFDLVEIDADKDKNKDRLTIKLGAKIIGEVL